MQVDVQFLEVVMTIIGGLEKYLEIYLEFGFILSYSTKSLGTMVVSFSQFKFHANALI